MADIINTIVDEWIKYCDSTPPGQLLDTECASITDEDIAFVLDAIKNVGKGWLVDTTQWYNPIADAITRQMRIAKVHIAAKDFFMSQLIKRFQTSVCCAHEAWGSAAVLGTLAAGMQAALSQFHHTGIGAVSSVCNITIQHALQPRRMPPMMCVYLNPAAGVDTEDASAVMGLFAGKLEYRQLNDFVLSSDVLKATDIPVSVAAALFLYHGLRCCRQTHEENVGLFDLSESTRTRLIACMTKSKRVAATEDISAIQKLPSFSDSGLGITNRSAYARYSYNAHAIVRCVRYLVCATSVYDSRQSISQLALRIELNMPGCIVYPHVRPDLALELWAVVPQPILRPNATFQITQHLHARQMPGVCTSSSAAVQTQWLKTMRAFISQRHFQLCASVDWAAHTYDLQADHETFLDIERDAFAAASPSSVDPLIPRCAEGVLKKTPAELNPVAIARMMELVNGCPAVQPLINYVFLVQQIQRRSLFIAICGVPAVRRITMCRSLHPTSGKQEWMAVTDGSDMHALLTLSTTTFRELDVCRSFSTVLEQMQMIFGIEATLQLLRKATSVDPVMLNIILSQLAHRGDLMDGLSRTTVLRNLKGAVASLTFECPTVYAREAAIKGGIDNMDAIVSNLMVGNVVPVGTGLVDIRMQKAAFDDAPEAVNRQRHTRFPERRPASCVPVNKMSASARNHNHDVSKIMAALSI